MKTLSSCLFALAAAILCSCTENESLSVDQIVVRQEAMRRVDILSSDNTVIPSSLKDVHCYYVSASGDDANDGLSARHPVRTISRLSSLQLDSGDVVLFRRGDVWRISDDTLCVSCCRGVTYSSYGRGVKPAFYGSPYDGAREGEWILTDVPGVYRYSLPFRSDVGAVVMDESFSAQKVMIERRSSGAHLHVVTGEPFESWRDLSRDMDFFQEGETLYLCSLEGVPSSVYDEIEFNMACDGFKPSDYVNLDNLCIRHCGNDAIHASGVTSLHVTNCEIGWTGGSIFMDDPSRKIPTRAGNGISMYGSCSDFLVKNCYIYQCYDAGLSHSYNFRGTDSVLMSGVGYIGNLIADCVYSVEYYLPCGDTPDVPRLISDMRIEDNICLRAGYGWGSQRPDKYAPRHIRTWHSDNHMTGGVIRGNTFYKCTHQVFEIHSARPEWAPLMENNITVE